jgi:hypothetical protein
MGIETMKRLVAACIVMAAASPSIAATTNLGTLSGPLTTAQFTGVGPSEDLFNFQLAEAGDLYGTVTNINLAPFYSSAGWVAELYQGLSPSGTFIGSVGSGFSVSFSNLLASTDYTIRVTGSGSGNLGGAYALTLVPQTAAPVPGPAGILVAGAAGAVVAFRTHRRRRKTRQLAAA